MYWKFGSLSTAVCVVLTSLAGLATYALFNVDEQTQISTQAIAIDTISPNEPAVVAPIYSARDTAGINAVIAAAEQQVDAVAATVQIEPQSPDNIRHAEAPKRLFVNDYSSPYYFEQNQQEAFHTASTDHFKAGDLAHAALVHATLQEDWSFFPKELNVPEPFVIMLDPGHGGSDPGSASHNGLLEKVLTLEIAKRAALFLSEIDNIEVKLTRDKDIGLTRTGRVRRVKRSNADLVVSLHLNHIPGSDINLVETFYAGPQNIAESQQKMREAKAKRGMVMTRSNHSSDVSFTQGSRKLAHLMQNRVYGEVQMDSPNAIDAGVKRDTLYILTRSFTPGVLIELSCLSNKEEAKRLKDPAYRDRLAAAVADGIRDYLTTPEAKKQYGFGV